MTFRSIIFVSFLLYRTSIPLIFVSVPMCAKSCSRYLKSLLQTWSASASVILESTNMLIEFLRSIMRDNFLWVKFFVDSPRDLMLVQQIASSLSEFDVLKGFMYKSFYFLLGWGGRKEMILFLCSLIHAVSITRKIVSVRCGRRIFNCWSLQFSAENKEEVCPLRGGGISGGIGHFII